MAFRINSGFSIFVANGFINDLIWMLDNAISITTIRFNKCITSICLINVYHFSYIASFDNNLLEKKFRKLLWYSNIFIKFNKYNICYFNLWYSNNPINVNIIDLR